MSTARRRDVEVGERVPNVVGRGYAASSEGKKGVLEVKVAEKDQVLDTDHPGPATCSEQTNTPQPEEEEVEGHLTLNLRGKFAKEGLVRVKDRLIFCVRSNGAVKYLRIKTDPHGPSKLRQATAKFLENHGLTWVEEMDKPGCFLVTFDGRPTKKGIEKEEYSWRKKKRDSAAGRERKTDVVRC